MELNTVLVYLTFLNCAAMLMGALRFRRWGWVAVTLAIAAITAGILAKTPARAGPIGATLLAVFIVVPSLGRRWTNRLAQQDRFGLAELVSWVIAILHPLDGWRMAPAFFRSMKLARAGKTQAATELLERIGQRDRQMAVPAKVRVLTLNHQWIELLEMLDQRFAGNGWQQNLDLLPAYLRAMGETGQIDRLVQTCWRYRPALDHAAYQMIRPLVWMTLSAFTGDQQVIDLLMRHDLRHHRFDEKQLWRATAALANGQSEQGQSILRELLASKSAVIRTTAKRRLQSPPPVAHAAMSNESRQLLTDIRRELLHDQLSLARRHFFYDRALTLLLVLANIAVFVLQMRRGGSSNLYVLYQMGALHPQTVVRLGEWWRLITANFLHAGELHLAMNMLALITIGPFVERTIGKWRFLVVYLLSGIGAFAVVTQMYQRRGAGDEIVVGASAAICGLIGATAAIAIIDWVGHRMRLAPRRLMSILMVIGIQVTFDMFTPQVSGLGHGAGIAIGLLIALLIGRRTIANPEKMIAQ